MVESNASLDLTPRPPETTIGAEERSGRSDLTISSEIHCDCSARPKGRGYISTLRARCVRFRFPTTRMRRFKGNWQTYQVRRSRPP